MSHEIQALKNRIKRTESNILKLQSEYQELLERMDKLEEIHPMDMSNVSDELVEYYMQSNEPRKHP